MNLVIDKPTVSVGIVVFNTRIEVLRATIEALKSSTIKLEIICLCNSLTQDYQEAVKEICKDNEALCIANQPNRGFGAGHNLIIQQVVTDWYVCCNPDLVVNSFSIERLIEFGSKHPKVGLIMPKILNPDGSIQPLARQDPTVFRWLQRQLWRLFPNCVRPYESRFDYEKSQPVEFVSGCFFAAKVCLLKALNGFDESFFLYAEDADLSKRARDFGINWYFAESSVTHYWAAAWRSDLRAFLRNANGMLSYWRKHGLL